MPKKRKIDPFVVWMYFLIGISRAVEISLEHPYGLFLRDSYNKNEIPDPNTVSKTFIINEPADYYKIKAQNGPFESHQTVPKSLLDDLAAKNRKSNSLMHRRVVFNMDVSAHIVTRDISPKLPRLQVLVHASPYQKSQSPSNQNRYWCAQVYVEANSSVLSAVCILNEKDQVCVAGIDLHKEWWTENGTSVRVSYSFNGIDQNDQCASASNAIIPVKSIQNNNESGIQKQEIAILNLIHNEQSFEEWKDQDILIDVPREMFHQSDSFEIPIRLEKNSDLQIFVMRARVRQGLRITGARMTDPSSQWSIHVDIKEHQKTGTVTAFVRDAKIYTKSERKNDLVVMRRDDDHETTNSFKLTTRCGPFTHSPINQTCIISSDVFAI